MCGCCWEHDCCGGFGGCIVDVGHGGDSDPGGLGGTWGTLSMTVATFVLLDGVGCCSTGTCWSPVLLVGFVVLLLLSDLSCPVSTCWECCG